MFGSVKVKNKHRKSFRIKMQLMKRVRWFGALRTAKVNFLNSAPNDQKCVYLTCH